LVDYAEYIYVRVYEERIDLLRAAIVGPAGTPYHDGLFFFDVRFPSDYPKCPPVCDCSVSAFPCISAGIPMDNPFPKKIYLIFAESSLPFRWTSVKSKPV
jgi:hypothetical protein